MQALIRDNHSEFYISSNHRYDSSGIFLCIPLHSEMYHPHLWEIDDSFDSKMMNKDPEIS